MTVTARVDLDGGLCACFGGAVGVDRSGNVAIYDGNAKFIFQMRKGLFDKRGLARAWRCH